MSRTAVLLTLIALVGAAACTDSAATPGPDSVVVDDTTPPPDTTSPVTTGPDSLPTVTFLSEPVDAGPLLGSGARDVEADAAAPPEVEPCLDDEEFCEDIDDIRGDLLPDEPPFVPAPADAAFCAVLADIEDRPFPSDEFEAILVAEAWFAELAPTVPPEHAADFAVLTDWLDRAAASGGDITFDDEYGADVDDASERLGDYVDTNCYGYGVRAPDVPTTEPVVPTTEPVVPTTEFVAPDITSELADEPAGPLFGEQAMEEFESSGSPSVAGFEPSGEGAPFCRLLDAMADRHLPIDEDDEIQVVLAWSYELLPLVPSEISEQFTDLIEFVQYFVAAEAGAEPADPVFDIDFQQTIDDINTYVDVNCYGY